MRQPDYSPPEGYTTPVDINAYHAVQNVYLDRIDTRNTYVTRLFT